MHDRSESFWSDVTADALAHFEPPIAARTPAARAIFRCAVSSAGFRCSLVYRCGRWSRIRLPIIGRIISKMLYWFGRHWYGVAIASTARIGGGLILPHPQGIVVGADVIVGPRAWIFQNVTIGGAPNRVGMPKIGSDARLYAAAVVAGPITLGDHVTIGGNTIVWKDVPDRTRVRCSDPVYESEGPRE